MNQKMMINQKGNEVLLVSNGLRRKVISDTVLINIIDTLYDGNPYKLTVVSEESNRDIFPSVLVNKFYTLNAENTIILSKRNFDTIINASYGEFGNAFFYWMNKPIGLNIISLFNNESIMINGSEVKFSFKKNNNDILYVENRYAISKPEHPIDFVHSKIKRQGSYLIGIVLDDGESVLTQPPIMFLEQIAKTLSRGFPAKFVLFGSNQTRETMFSSLIGESGLMRNSDIFSFVCENNETKIIAEAMHLCDVIISHESYYMHVALAMGKQVYGIFANSSSDDFGEFDNLVRFEPKTKATCSPCRTKYMEANDCTSFNGNDEPAICYESIDVNYLVSSIIKYLITNKGGK